MKARLGLALAACLTAAALGVAIANAGSSTKDPFKSVRSATDHFRNPAVAEAAGYTLRLPDVNGNTCIAEQGVGTMGVHFVNTNLLDATLHLLAPEVLVYEPKANGGFKLVAVEYVAFQDAWDKGKGRGGGAARSTAAAVRPSIRVRRYAEPVRASGVLRAPCVGVEEQPAGAVRRLESEGQLLVTHKGAAGHEPAVLPHEPLWGENVTNSAQTRRPIEPRPRTAGSDPA